MIREPTDGEVGLIVALGEQLHSMSSFAPLRYNYEKTIDAIFDLLDNGHYAKGDFAEDGRLRGFMLGMCTPAYFTDDLIAYDLMLGTDPEHGRGTTAYRLVKDFTRWAKEKGAKQIRPGITTGRVSGNGEQLYERLGFERVGATFVREV